MPPVADQPSAPASSNAGVVRRRVDVVFVCDETGAVELEAAVAPAGVYADGLPTSVETYFCEFEAVGEGVAEVELLVLWLCVSAVCVDSGACLCSTLR